MNQITPEKIKKYLDITEKALASVVVVKEQQQQANEVLDMAQRYFHDAQYYHKKGDWVTAFAAVNYAHGWLDCGTRLGVLNVQKNFHLFTIDRDKER